MKTNLYILTVFLMEIGMLVGCSADGIPEETTGDRPGGLTYLRFGVEAISGQVVVNDGERTFRPETRSGETSENTLQNLTVLQFDLDSTELKAGSVIADEAKCVTARYLRNPEMETGTPEGSQGYYLIGLKASEKATQYLVFIANAGSTFQNYTGTLGEFKARTIPFDQKTNNGENQLMLAARYVPVKGVDDVTVYPVELERLVAQVYFNYTDSMKVIDSRFTPISLRLRNVPKVLKYADGLMEADDYPEKKPANYMDYPPIIDRIGEGFSWYIPLNKRSGTATDDNTYCTCVELSGSYEAPNMEQQLATYTFYIETDGKRNVHRNYRYEITPMLRGVNSFDDHVSTRNLTVSPSANCFVIAPEAGSEITFNPHDSPGTDVAGTEIVYADQVIEDQYSRIADVRTVWQTAENLISVTFADGLVRVVPNANGVDGNALIAAYATDNTTILWSWHIWVTPYAKVLDGTGTNGYIHTLKDNNNTFDWMDRNLGVLNVYRDADNRNLYYQWGRKDPFYDTSKTTINSDGTGISAADKGTALNIDASVKNPTVFFQQSSGGKTGTWHGGSAAITNLWDPDTKTVFDPCPAGWRVPEKVAWDFYKWGSSGNIAWDTTNSFGAVLTVSSGVYSWFPGGILKNDLTFDARSIYMWSSEWDTNPYTYYITYSVSGATINSSGNVVNTIAGFNGGSVRCVKMK